MSCGQQQALPRGVRLTFDDGPSAITTPHLLDHLKRFGVKATFFVVGQNITKTQGLAIVERIAAEGHQIGNHSFSHANLTHLDAAQIEREIKDTEDLIGSLDGGVKLFRPPYGFRNAVVDQVVENSGISGGALECEFTGLETALPKPQMGFTRVKANQGQTELHRSRTRRTPFDHRAFSRVRSRNTKAARNGVRLVC